jgi:uncharacterized protein (TIGR02266 family)
MSERLHGRIPFCVKVKFRTASSLLVSYSLNLSRGGIFLETETDLEVGRELSLEFDAPQAGPVLIHGRVTWRRKVADEEGPVGLGVEFDDMSDVLGSMIDHLVSDFAGISVLVFCREAKEREALRRMLRAIMATVEVVGADSREVAETVLGDEVDLLVVEADTDIDDALALVAGAARLASPIPTVALTDDVALGKRLRAAGALDVINNPPSFAELQRAAVRAIGRPSLISRG